ncbi:hypothetical protein Dimus_037774, partial [Dionaea muscipula]
MIQITSAFIVDHNKVAYTLGLQDMNFKLLGIYEVFSPCGGLPSPGCSLSSNSIYLDECKSTFHCALEQRIQQLLEPEGSSRMPILAISLQEKVEQEKKTSILIPRKKIQGGG